MTYKEIEHLNLRAGDTIKINCVYNNRDHEAICIIEDYGGINRVDHLNIRVLMYNEDINEVGNTYKLTSLEGIWDIVKI